MRDFLPWWGLALAGWLLLNGLIVIVLAVVSFTVDRRARRRWADRCARRRWSDSQKVDGYGR